MQKNEPYHDDILYSNNERCVTFDALWYIIVSFNKREILLDVKTAYVIVEESLVTVTFVR
jgi:hypothetical protein